MPGMIWKAGQGDAYGLLASLWTQWGEAAPPPRVERRAGGKPWFPDRPDVCFSVSRSGETALCALAGHEIGADIELVRPRSAGLPRYCLGETEYAWFHARGSRWEDFYTLWTMKEARVKCTGEGIFRVSARAVAVPLCAPGERAALAGFRFIALAGENWRGAVCEKMS